MYPESEGQLENHNGHKHRHHRHHGSHQRVPHKTQFITTAIAKSDGENGNLYSNLSFTRTAASTDQLNHVHSESNKHQVGLSISCN